MAANKDGNWLLAIVLHSFAKVADGARLTDLEAGIVDAFKKNGFSDEEIRQHGETEKRMPQSLRNQIFPARFAQLDVKQNYAAADLARDAREITRAVLARPNVTNVDVAAIHAGRARLQDFTMPAREVLREHGSAMLVATEAGAAPAGARFTIKAVSFRCVDRATDSIFGPSNEPYWIFGSLGSGITVTTRSQVFGDVDSGETRTFGSSEGCVWGQNCAPQALPQGEIGSLVSLFEHDEGDTAKIKAGFAAAFAAASGILVASGVAAWVGAVVAGLGGVLQWLLTFLDDDHIADNTFVFTGSVVAKQVPNVGSTMDIIRRFSDGDADYTLTLRITRVS
ncbi:hypothetical protein [Embleya sp. NBC_00896]|uniref:hypothetical protein n=1 Tax=Embleya sp. NBC_00896 TaxID=2975961 RepID=UPI00386585CA|nr:hypothetical protein OG928_07310 [Embleya sp. NBC_00896]